MIAVLQRVSFCSVVIEGVEKSKIGNGLLIFVGIEDADNQEDVDWLSAKIVNMRIFNDAEGVMNVSVKDAEGEIMIVSQFTLHASIKKGNRPSYVKAAKPGVSIPIYEKFIESTEINLRRKVSTGVFGADMKINLLNDGPVTIVVDTKNKV